MYHSVICTCGRYQEVGIPCGHAIACIRKLRRPPCDYIPEYFTVRAFRATYATNFLPIDITDLKKSPHCHPPILGAPKGWPPTRRKRAGDRMTRGLTGPRRPPVIDVDIEVEPEILRTVLPAPIKQKCGKCKEEGHNARKCRKPLALDLIVLEDD